MKKVLAAMIGMFLLMVFPGGGIWVLMQNIIGGGAAETYLYPIYGGIILLSGLVVGCTVVVLKEIRSLKDEIMKIKNDGVEKEQ